MVILWTGEETFLRVKWKRGSSNPTVCHELEWLGWFPVVEGTDGHWSETALGAVEEGYRQRHRLCLVRDAHGCRNFHVTWIRPALILAATPLGREAHTCFWLYCPQCLGQCLEYWRCSKGLFTYLVEGKNASPGGAGCGGITLTRV